MKYKGTLHILPLFLMIGSFGYSQLKYDYQFTEKLRWNIDNMIKNGPTDTCGTIDLHYPIELTTQGYLGDPYLHFQVENDCSKFIDLSKLVEGLFLEIGMNEKYGMIANSKEVLPEDIYQLTLDFYSSIDQTSIQKKGAPKVMLRIDRSCSNTNKTNELLNFVHKGYFEFVNTSNALASIELIFHLGTSSRAEPPVFNISED